MTELIPGFQEMLDKFKAGLPKGWMVYLLGFLRVFSALFWQ